MRRSFGFIFFIFFSFLVLLDRIFPGLAVGELSWIFHIIHYSLLTRDLRLTPIDEINGSNVVVPKMKWKMSFMWSLLRDFED